MPITDFRGNHLFCIDLYQHRTAIFCHEDISIIRGSCEENLTVLCVYIFLACHYRTSQWSGATKKVAIINWIGVFMSLLFNVIDMIGDGVSAS